MSNRELTMLVAIVLACVLITNVTGVGVRQKPDPDHVAHDGRTYEHYAGSSYHESRGRVTSDDLVRAESKSTPPGPPGTGSGPGTSGTPQDLIPGFEVSINRQYFPPPNPLYPNDPRDW